MIKQSLPLSPLLKEIIGVTNMGRTVNSKKIICKSCGDGLNNNRARISSLCVTCKSAIEGDYKIYVKEPLGTRKEFSQMSSAQSFINRSLKF